ncbi:MAG: hypothetical protein D6732_08495 [Methanobacteriota archaeon]|nr:MAG: hypothetical protein D6732_08495 [Euryarchaeota archaeon]
MKISNLLFYLALITMLVIVPVSMIVSNPITTKGWVFTETRSGYSIYGGQYFRFKSTQTFFLESFEPVYGSNIVNLNVVKEGTDGDVKKMSQPLKRANFIFYFAQEGRLATEFDAIPLLVRDNVNPELYPFNNTETNFLSAIYCEQSSCRFNLESEKTFLNFNFEFIQLASIDGQLRNLTVNVELNTNNFESGLIERTAVHIIKRDENQKIIYRMDHSIQKVSQAARYLRVLDNEFLQIPYLFLLLWIIARVYNKATKYIEENNIRIWYKEKTNPEN